VENVEIAAILDEISTLLEIKGANPFRIRAYENAARTVETHTTPMRKLVAEGTDLTELPAIGKDLARHIAELVTTGRLAMLDQLTDEIPRSLVELVRLPGVGAKRVRVLWEAIGITTIDALEQAARSGAIAELRGFGAKSQDKILRAIEGYRRRGARIPLGDVDELVQPLLEYLAGCEEALCVEVAGSYRRRVETVGDVDVLVAATDGQSVIEHFTRYPNVRAVERARGTRATVRLGGGLQVDLRAVPPESYGAALQYFTGSKAHNVKLRTWAVARGLRISEYGVFKVDPAQAQDDDPYAGECVAGRDEREVYEALGMPYIVPELREDRGELEAAREDALPSLITLADMRGDLQMHSTWSDGTESIEAMARACSAKGYEYLAITDHSKALAMTGGLDAARMRQQWVEIEEVQARHPEIRILRSVEVDILADGSLDLEDEMLEALDLVVVSVHSRLDLPSAEQTARITRALEHSRVDVLAHPTGRLLNRRDPMVFDVDTVLEAAAERGVAVELNAHPDRLDLRDTHLMRAKELGVKVVISTDAHRVRDLDLMHYGIEQARRAWLSPSDVLNTQPLDELLAATRRLG
jgi:DNA polymerase (family 10)